MENNIESISMMMITYSGMAKSSAMEAIGLAEKGEDATAKFDEAEENLRLAGQEHMKLLSMSANEEVKVNVLLLHAEDQMLNAETTILLSKKIVDLHIKIDGK